MINKCIFVLILSAIQVSLIKGKINSIFDEKITNNEFKMNISSSSLNRNMKDFKIQILAIN